MIKEISAENYLGIEIQEHELFDHEHLFEDINDVLLRSKQVGVTKLLTICTTFKSNSINLFTACGY